MSVKLLGKIAVGATCALMLAACVDVDVDVAITSPTTAKATMTQTMNAELYSMMKMNAESDGDEPGFCDEGTATENADGSATCAITEEGPFADLDLSDEDGGMTFTEVGPGLVRVALPTETLNAEMGVDEEMDEQTREMVTALFEGHDITITISGDAVVETNMERAADGRSVSQVIPMLDLINGTLDLPDEFYAVVRAP